MGKVEDKKRIKRESLFSSAFTLFTSQGINETSISDIAKHANMAKGTFYLYFKDKFDLRDKLIAHKTSQLLQVTIKESKKKKFENVEDKVIFVADYVIDRLNEDKLLLKFISKNLSWGAFEKVLIDGADDSEVSFYDSYISMLEESGKRYRDPNIMLYMILELLSSTCYQVILFQNPVSLDKLKPELYMTIKSIMKNHEMK